ncbi:MAG TPA: threonine synthase, partial [Deltaproteobacteria bacterium]|nr:threonine synthase [Deltaproteobacteria bacterium]
GHVVCTQGGESIAGLRKALAHGLLPPCRTYVVDSTSHHLKFATFQERYFTDTLDPDYGITPRDELKNAPVELEGDAQTIAAFLGLKKKG